MMKMRNIVWGVNLWDAVEHFALRFKIENGSHKGSHGRDNEQVFANLFHVWGPVGPNNPPKLSKTIWDSFLMYD